MTDSTISAERAAELLTSAEGYPAPWKNLGGYISASDGGCVNGTVAQDGATACGELVAAAPLLAATVIKQAEQITRLAEQLSEEQAKRASLEMAADQAGYDL